MGLDMYLNGSRYISSYKEADKVLSEDIAALLPELKGFGDIDDPAVSDLKIRVGYWRKANAIHKWFVDNVQEGVDDCRSHYVSRDDLLTLKQACVNVLADHSLAEELLPSMPGFFFGTTELDEWYFDSLQQTVDIVDRCVELPDDWTFEYQSSW